MEQLKVIIIGLDQIAKETFKLDLGIDRSRLEGFKPGQFIHIQINSGTEFMLRRPISIANIDLENELLTVIFKVFGKGTEQLTQLRPGELLDILVPCGNGYPIDTLNCKQALLIGGGIGIPPLYYLARKLVDQGVELTTILGFQTKDDIFYHDEFKELGQCYLTTDDGSYGRKGYVTDVIEQEELNFDYYFSCGPTAMLKNVKKQLQYFPGYISLEERMGCGVGTCYACVVPTADGKQFKKVCSDGPVFKAEEVKI